VRHENGGRRVRYVNGRRLGNIHSQYQGNQYCKCDSHKSWMNAGNNQMHRSRATPTLGQGSLTPHLLRAGHIIMNTYVSLASHTTTATALFQHCSGSITMTALHPPPPHTHKSHLRQITRILHVTIRMVMERFLKFFYFALKRSEQHGRAEVTIEAPRMQRYLLEDMHNCQGYIQLPLFQSTQFDN
jgi:hypothetical protein